MKFTPEYIKNELELSYSKGAMTDGFINFLLFIIRGRMHHFVKMYREPEDIIQTCYLNIIKKFNKKQIDPQRNVFNYITTCVVNEFRQQARKMDNLADSFNGRTFA